ncbi:MAG: hypothetical protein GF401_18330 [Chitinivibrionales bacterium]|nr:hypothetical protein [Chitinivibrionales bacterium]
MNSQAENAGSGATAKSTYPANKQSLRSKNRNGDSSVTTSMKAVAIFLLCSIALWTWTLSSYHTKKQLITVTGTIESLQDSEKRSAFRLIVSDQHGKTVEYTIVPNKNGKAISRLAGKKVEVKGRFKGDPGRRNITVISWKG